MPSALVVRGGPAQSGGGITWSVPGVLAIRSNAGQVPAFANDAFQPRGLSVAVTGEPVGAALEVEFWIESSPPVLLAELAIGAGETRAAAEPEEVAGFPPVPADTNVRLDIVGVGSSFPGEHLTASLF